MWILETTHLLRMLEANDRRYAEVNVEREKALKIKETADLAALSLAREIQTYKDEKANELRSQIERERGTYVTQEQMAARYEALAASIRVVTDYMSTQQGRDAATRASQVRTNAIVVIGLTVVAIIVAIANGIF